MYPCNSGECFGDGCSSKCFLFAASSAIETSSRLPASTDVCVGFIAQPLYVVYILLPEQSRHCFFVKIIANTATTMFGLVSLLTLTTISIDRVLALNLGLRYRNVVTLKRVRSSVITFWLFSVAVSMISLYYFRVALVIICILLLLCIAIPIFCYTKIYVTLRHREAQVQGDINQEQHNKRRITVNIARYRKTVSTALWVQLMLLICYLPYCIVIAVYAYTGKRSLAHDLGWAATLSFYYLNSSLNPILYCWRIREVRQAVKGNSRTVLLNNVSYFSLQLPLGKAFGICLSCFLIFWTILIDFIHRRTNQRSGF